MMQNREPLRGESNLRETPYRYTWGCYELVFSSDFNLRRFANGIREERKRFRERCRKLYGIEVCYDTVSLFRFYQRIERRGFLVYVKYNDITQPLYSPSNVQIVADVRILPFEGE